MTYETWGKILKSITDIWLSLIGFNGTFIYLIHRFFLKTKSVNQWETNLTEHVEQGYCFCFSYSSSIIDYRLFTVCVRTVYNYLHTNSFLYLWQWLHFVPWLGLKHEQFNQCNYWIRISSPSPFFQSTFYHPQLLVLFVFLNRYFKNKTVKVFCLDCMHSPRFL